MVTLQLRQLDVPPGQRLQIDQLREGAYIAVAESPSFPGWPLQMEIPKYVKQSRVEGRNQAMRAFRQWVWERLGQRSPF